MINRMIAYAALGGPFLVVLLDLLILRQVTLPRKWLGIALAALGMVAVPFIALGDGSIPIWLILVPGLLLLSHFRSMQGLGRYPAILGWLELCSLVIGVLVPETYLGVLAGFVAVAARLVIPALSLWYLWLTLPLVYDTFRGGDWAEKGIPLIARYRWLAAIALVALISAGWLGWQMASYRAVLVGQENALLHDMRWKLDGMEHSLKWRAEIDDWQARLIADAEEYQANIWDISVILRQRSIGSSSPLSVLLELPKDVFASVERTGRLTEEDASRLLTSVIEIRQALEEVIADYRPLSLSTYERLASKIQSELTQE
ncbi:MAG: hypothetical protein ACOX18_04340 [Bacillota bacterium]|jgi:hypothetical protein